MALKLVNFSDEEKKDEGLSGLKKINIGEIKTDVSAESSTATPPSFPERVASSVGEFAKQEVLPIAGDVIGEAGGALGGSALGAIVGGPIGAGIGAVAGSMIGSGIGAASGRLATDIAINEDLSKKELRDRAVEEAAISAITSGVFNIGGKALKSFAKSGKAAKVEKKVDELKLVADQISEVTPKSSSSISAALMACTKIVPDPIRLTCFLPGFFTSLKR